MTSLERRHGAETSENTIDDLDAKLARLERWLKNPKVEQDDAARSAVEHLMKEFGAQREGLVERLREIEEGSETREAEEESERARIAVVDSVYDQMRAEVYYALAQAATGRTEVADNQIAEANEALDSFRQLFLEDLTERELQPLLMRLARIIGILKDPENAVRFLAEEMERDSSKKRMAWSGATWRTV